VALRLTLGILAVTLVPLGLVFVVLGLVVDEPDRGRPEAFLYVGAPLALTGLAFTVAFILLWRRQATRRQRRRQGLRTRAEVVRADVNWRVTSPSTSATSRTSSGSPTCPAQPATVRVRRLRWE
jgi:hypothetical protein